MVSARSELVHLRALPHLRHGEEGGYAVVLLAQAGSWDWPPPGGGKSKGGPLDMSVIDFFIGDVFKSTARVW